MVPDQRTVEMDSAMAKAWTGMIAMQKATNPKRDGGAIKVS